MSDSIIQGPGVLYVWLPPQPDDSATLEAQAVGLWLMDVWSSSPDPVDVAAVLHTSLTDALEAVPEESRLAGFAPVLHGSVWAWSWTKGVGLCVWRSRWRSVSAGCGPYPEDPASAPGEWVCVRRWVGEYDADRADYTCEVQETWTHPSYDYGKEDR